MSDARHLVGKLWSTATTCAAPAWGVIDYTPQLTYLLLLKMMQERATRNLGTQQIASEAVGAKVQPPKNHRI